MYRLSITSAIPIPDDAVEVLPAIVKRKAKVNRDERVAQLKSRVGRELANSLLRVLELQRQDFLGNRAARSKLASLRSYMGHHYWAILMRVCEFGTLTAGVRGVDPHKSIREARDSLVIVGEWEGECDRWGL